MSNHKVGEVLAGKYEIKAILGAGGMGTVYRARQIDLGRDVAIKVPIASALEIPGFLARFSREARTVAKLVHDNIVQVYEYSQSEESVYIVMEYVEGQDLKSLVQVPTPDLTVKDMATILRDSCEGLAHAHENGIVHRDIKPHNIMVQQRGRGKWRVKIMDFGIAHLEENANITMNQEHLTVTGQAIGTPSYMSPEQIRGVGVSGQSDIYSFGCVIYFVFTRQTPFQGTGFTVAAAHLSDAPPRVRARVPQLPEEIDGVIQRCLAKDPALRPENASDLGQEIYEALKPIFDKKMSEIWPDASHDGGGTDLIKPTKPLDPAAQSAPTLASTVMPQGGTVTDSPAASQPTMVDPRLKASVDAQPIKPVQHQTVTRTGTAVTTGVNDATMNVGGPLSEAPAPLPSASSGEFFGGPPTPPSAAGEAAPYAEPVAAPSKPPLALIGGVLALCLVGGVSIGVWVMNKKTATAPVDGPGNTIVTPTTPGKTSEPKPTPASAGTPAVEGTQVAVAIPQPTREPAEKTPVAATPVPSAVPTKSPVPSPSVDPVIEKLAQYQTRFDKLTTLEERVGLWRDLVRESDPRLHELADKFALAIATKPELHEVESGTYTRGGGGPDNPVGNVRFGNNFSIGLYEVTAVEFCAFLNDVDPKIVGKYAAGRSGVNIVVDSSGHYSPAPGRELDPANNVTWNQANEYAKWLSLKTGDAYSLPTEAQWEVAARSGNAKKIYPWGESSPKSEYGTFLMDKGSTSGVTTSPEGRNDYGLYNMAGNVAEWCLDVYASAAYEPGATDPLILQAPEASGRPKRVLRGGSYLEDKNSDALKATTRSRSYPDDVDPSYGFRIVRNSK